MKKLMQLYYFCHFYAVSFLVIMQADVLLKVIKDMLHNNHTFVEKVVFQGEAITEVLEFCENCLTAGG
jgi:hypothetical protein